MHVRTFLKYLQFERRYSPRTISSYETDLAQFEAFLKSEFEATPEAANYGLVRSWIVKLSEEGLDASSINRKIACLRSFYKFLMKQEVVAKDPMLKIKVLKTRKKLPHFVNENEMVALLDRPMSELSEDEDEFTRLRDQLVLELLYGTGMRLSELIQLKDRDINWRDQTIKVLGKRNKERVIPFAQGIVPLMEAYRDARNREINRTDHDGFFVTKEGKKVYPVMIYRIVKRGLAGAQVEKKSPHVLRHTYATHLLNKGAEINAVKDLLGHSSLAATQVYTHNTMEKLKKIFDQAHPKA